MPSLTSSAKCGLLGQPKTHALSVKSTTTFGPESVLGLTPSLSGYFTSSLPATTCHLGSVSLGSHFHTLAQGNTLQGDIPQGSEQWEELA